MTEDDIKRSVLYHVANMNLNEEDGAGIYPTKGDDRPAEVTPEEYDEHLQKVIKINHQGTETFAKIIGRKRDKDGSLKGKSNDNSRLDTMLYVGETVNGDLAEFTANMVAENLFAICDDDDNLCRIFYEIVDCEQDGDSAVVNVRWKDGGSCWVPLSLMKESEPIAMAEHAVAAQIADWPAFAPWVHRVLNRRKTIISEVNSRKFKGTKFGLPLPMTAEQAYEIDRNDPDKRGLWAKAIAKEMKAVEVAFDFRPGDKLPKGYKIIKCHLVFDIKQDWTRKARFVAGGHMTTPDANVPIYASVASRESVKILLTLAGLNNLRVLAANIMLKSDRIHYTEFFGKGTSLRL